MFERDAGEVARHMQGTRVGSRPEDAHNRVADYPLLCTRRRFWEACFQAADAAGSHSQLRSQLRILHDSLENVADRSLGAAIPASDLVNALAPSLVSTGVLLNELNTRIQKLDDGGSDEGQLQRDLCGLVFLIGKLPRQEGADLGVRANAGTLADLVIDDLTTDFRPPPPRNRPYARVTGERRRTDEGRRRVSTADDRGSRMGPRLPRASSSADRSRDCHPP